jgi:hypothetical protein
MQHHNSNVIIVDINGNINSLLLEIIGEFFDKSIVLLTILISAMSSGQERMIEEDKISTIKPSYFGSSERILSRHRFI